MKYFQQTFLGMTYFLATSIFVFKSLLYIMLYGYDFFFQNYFAYMLSCFWSEGYMNQSCLFLDYLEYS